MPSPRWWSAAPVCSAGAAASATPSSGFWCSACVNNGLDHIQIDSFLKILIRGLILLAALIINVYAQVLKERQSDLD